jgi:DNA-binding response OmpR family regulator
MPCFADLNTGDFKTDRETDRQMDGSRQLVIVRVVLSRLSGYRVCRKWCVEQGVSVHLILNVSVS